MLNIFSIFRRKAMPIDPTRRRQDQGTESEKKKEEPKYINIFRIISLIYLIFTLVSILKGWESYKTAILFPLLISWSLWRLTIYKWYLFLSCLVLSTLYYAFCFITTVVAFLLDLLLGAKIDLLSFMFPLIYGTLTIFLRASFLLCKKESIKIIEPSVQVNKKAFAFCILIPLLFLISPYFERPISGSREPERIFALKTPYTFMRGVIAEKENVEKVIKIPIDLVGLAIGYDNHSIITRGRSGDGLYLTDILTEKETRRLGGWDVVRFKFSKDGNYLYVGTKQSVAIIDSVDKYTVKRVIKVRGTIVSFDQGLDGDYLILLIKDEAKDSSFGVKTPFYRIDVYEVSTCKPVRSFKVDAAGILSSSGQYFALVGRDENIIIYNAVTCDVHKRLSVSSLDKTKIHIQAISYSHNGRLLAIRYDDGTINILETNDYRPVVSFNAYSAKTLTISPDDKYLASISGGSKINIWDMKTGAIIKSLQGHYDYEKLAPLFWKRDAFIHSIAFSPNGEFIAAVGGGYITVWNLSDKGGND